MRTSSETMMREAPSMQRAWSCLTANLIVPGFGTLMAGRRVSGILQTALSIAGLGLVVVFCVRFVGWYIAHFTDITGADDPVTVLGNLWFSLRWWVIGGLGLFLVATVWALITSVVVLRDAKAREAVPPVI